MTTKYDDEQQLFQQYNENLYIIAENLKQKKRASIPEDIDERLFSVNDTLIVVRPQTKNIIRITAALFEMSSTGSLTIGDRKWINLSSGIYTWFGLHWILQPDDVRSLSQAQPGIISLELMGESLVDTGVW